MADLSEPKYKRGSAESPTQQQLPKGAASNLNSIGGAPPAEPDLTGLREHPVEDSVSGQLTGFDDSLFQPTHRPNEPITTGSPFGPGANSVMRQGEESDSEFKRRMASSIINSPKLNSRTKAFLARVARGE